MELNWKDFFLKTAGVKETIVVFMFLLIMACIYLVGVSVGNDIRALNDNTKGLRESILLLNGKVENIEDDVNSFKDDLGSLKNRLSELEIQQKVIRENAITKIEERSESGGDTNYYIENATIDSDGIDPISIQNQKQIKNTRKRSGIE